MLVGSSLSAAYAVAVARARPGLVDRLVLISPTGTTSPSAAGRAFGGLLALPLVGTAAFNVLVSHASIQSYLRRAYGDPSLVDDPLVEQHWATAHQPNARLAPAAFVAGTLDLPLAPIPHVPIARADPGGARAVPGIGAQASDAELRGLGPRVTIETDRRGRAAARTTRRRIAVVALDRMAWLAATGVAPTTNTPEPALEHLADSLVKHRPRRYTVRHGQVAQLVRAPR